MHTDRHGHISRCKVVLKQFVVDEQRSVGVGEEQEDFLVWIRRCTCWWFDDVGVEPAKRLDTSLRGASVFDASPARRARRTRESSRHIRPAWL